MDISPDTAFKVLPNLICGHGCLICEFMLSECRDMTVFIEAFHKLSSIMDITSLFSLLERIVCHKIQKMIDLKPLTGINLDQLCQKNCDK